MNKVVKWGIIGCGGIANKFADSIKTVYGSEILGVASQTPGKAEAFKNKHGIKRFYTSYQQLLQDKDIDIVYIATTHNYHYKNAKQVLEAGKSLVCEKPFTVNSKEMKLLINLAAKKKLFMMEAMWTRFLPVMVQIRKWLKEEVIGEVKLIRAEFGFNCPYDAENRIFNPNLAGGALLDAGIYPLSFANMVMKEKPVEIKAIGEIGKTGVDVNSCYMLKFRTGCIALLNSTVNAPVDSRAEIVGTKGKIIIPKLFLGANNVILHLEGNEPTETKLPFIEEEGFQFEIKAAADSYKEGLLQNEIIPLTDTLQIMETIDEIKSQLGLVYGNDKL